MMKRTHNDDDEQQQQPQRKKIRFNIHEEEQPPQEQQIDIDKTIITHTTAEDARSLRGIRRTEGFQDQQSILGDIETTGDGFVKRVVGEEATNEENERLTVDKDTFGTVLFEPFTLDREREEGQIDQEGNVISERRIRQEKRDAKAKRDKHDINRLMKFDKRSDHKNDDDESEEEEEERDEWLTTLEEDEREILLKSRKLTRNTTNTTKESTNEQEDSKTKLLSIAKYCDIILAELQDDETIQQAISRLRPKSQNNSKKKQQQPSSSSENTSQIFDQFNIACSKLLALLNDYNLYNEKRNYFEQLAEEYDNSEFGKWYEYKWKNANDGVTYGPFSGRQMNSWKSHFIENPIQFRRITKQQAQQQKKKQQQQQHSEDTVDMFADDNNNEVEAEEESKEPFLDYNNTLEFQ
jgi:hypothetical protein